MFSGTSILSIFLTGLLTGGLLWVVLFFIVCGGIVGLSLAAFRGAPPTNLEIVAEGIAAATALVFSTFAQPW